MESSKEAVWTWPGIYKLHLEDRAFTADGSSLLEGESQNRAICMQRTALNVPNILCLTYIEI